MSVFIASSDTCTVLTSSTAAKSSSISSARISAPVDAAWTTKPPTFAAVLSPTHQTFVMFTDDSTTIVSHGSILFTSGNLFAIASPAVTISSALNTA